TGRPRRRWSRRSRPRRWWADGASPPAVRSTKPAGRPTGPPRSVRAGPSAAPVGAGSAEAELLLRVADQHVLGLLVVVKHHQVVLPADARGLVPAERGVCRVVVVVVHPHPARLDGAAGAVDGVLLPGPHP